MKIVLFSCLLALIASPSFTDAQSVISVHASGTTNPSKCYWNIMEQIEEQTKLPTRLTYRAVGSSTGQREFLAGDNFFGAGDIPISTEDFNTFDEEFYHLPVVLSSISFFHSIPTGSNQLNLNACTLAKIFKRDITDWTDSRIVDLNPNLLLPSSPYPITVAHRVLGSASTAGITQYLNAACPSEWPSELVGVFVAWPADTIGCEGSGGMVECIRDTPGSIGYIDSSHGHAEGLQELELQNRNGNYLSSKESNANGGILAAAENAGLPALDGDFGGVDLLNQVRVPMIAVADKLE
jgi:ABC-type phosphate transport system substrate-binding protein